MNSGSSPIPTRLVILAAGASSRMGQAKALLPVDDQPLLDKHLHDYGKYLSAVVVLGHEADHILATWLGLPPGSLIPGRLSTFPRAGQEVGVVVHPHWEEGQASSLQMALKTLARGEAALLTPVDCPPVAPTTVEHILKTSQLNPWGVLPRYQGQPGHPVWLSAALVELLATASSPLRLDEVLHHSGRHLLYVDVNDPSIVVNLNTPDGLSRWREARPCGQ